MDRNTVQAGAGTVQALANLVDAILNIGDLTSRAVEASSTLENVHSHMKAKMVELCSVRGNVEDRFRIYWFPKKQYDQWLKMVEMIDGQVWVLTTKFSDLQNLSHMQFPYRLDLIKEIGVICIEMDKVITQGKELGDALANRETKRIIKLATPINITNISSLQGILGKILEYLDNESINTIRVHGAVGTGKRAIIEHLNNHEAIVNNMFDIVLWVPTSDFDNRHKDSSIEACIQRIIAKRLGFGIGDSYDVNVITSKIHAELDGVKYLLLLDDIKVDIKLELIGIPWDTKGSKIVYTTNLPYVCPFGPFFNLKIGRLNETDSWQLFEDILIHENDTIKQHEIGAIAFKVVKWCDGLFSLIKIVAENFKSKRSPQSWSNGLQMLRKSAQKGDIYMQALENFLHFSYDGLEDHQKLCFLYSALYPKDSKIPIDCLFDCWAAEKFYEYGVVEDVGTTGQEILEHLLAMALLNEGSNKQYVTMDRVFRAAAIKILEHHQLKCLVAEDAVEKLRKNCCKDAHWISLANCEIHVLPTHVECPKLTTLFLQKNSELKDISDSFFDYMEKLKVLDLYETGIERMLQMRNLVCLKVLYVNGCNISQGLPFNMEGLDNLEVLDIRGTITTNVLDDIKRLKHLRRFMVSILAGDNLSHLMISQLCALKELIIDVKSDIIHKDEDSYMTWCNKVIENVIVKIDTFKELTTLQFRFKDDIVDVIQVRGDTLKIFVPNQVILERLLQERIDLKSYALQIYIGHRMAPNLEIPKCFFGYDSFVLCCDKIVNGPMIEDVMVKVKAFMLIKNNSIEHFDDVGISSSSMDHIQGCFVQTCNKIETFMQTGSFSSLKTLVLSKCFNLKVLFSNNVVQHIIGIEHLEIRDCLAIEEINMLSSNGDVDVFPKLKSLVLHNLPMLTRISSDMEWPLMNMLQIHWCRMLKKLPLKENSARNLRIIEVEKVWWGQLELSSDGIKEKFERYCVFSDM